MLTTLNEKVEVKETLIFFISNHCILSYSMARLNDILKYFIDSSVARWLWRQGVTLRPIKKSKTRHERATL